MKFNWRFLLAVQFAATAWIFGFASPIPYGNGLLGAIAFMMNRRVVLVELAVEIFTYQIPRQGLIFVTTLPFGLGIRSQFHSILVIWATLNIALFCVAYIAGGAGQVAIIGFVLKRIMKKKAPDILAMIGRKR